MKKVFLTGYYGKCNAGDDALAYVCIDQLGSLAGNKYCLQVLSDVPVSHSGNATISYADLTKRFTRLRSFISSDVIVFGGGGIFQDYLKTGLVDLREKHRLVKIAKILGRKIAFLGISVGPIVTSEGLALTSKILNAANLITVRDQQSYDFLANTLKNTKNLEKTFDLAVLLGESESLKNIAREPKTLGISLMPVSRSNLFKDQQKLLSNLGKTLTMLIDTHGYKLRMIEFSKNSGDSEIMEQLASVVGREQYVTRVPYDKNPVNVAMQVAQCSHYLAMRLHSAIFAYMCGVPFAMINYHDKCKGFANEIGLDPQCLIVSDDEAEFRVKLEALLLSGDQELRYPLDNAIIEAQKSFKMLKCLM